MWPECTRSEWERVGNCSHALIFSFDVDLGYECWSSMASSRGGFLVVDWVDSVLLCLVRCYLRFAWLFEMLGVVRRWLLWEG